jgi:tRNA(Ile2) C34 agmatinyltransferase TiaS
VTESLYPFRMNDEPLEVKAICPTCRRETPIQLALGGKTTYTCACGKTIHAERSSYGGPVVVRELAPEPPKAA